MPTPAVGQVQLLDGYSLFISYGDYEGRWVVQLPAITPDPSGDGSINEIDFTVDIPSMPGYVLAFEIGVDDHDASHFASPVVIDSASPPSWLSSWSGAFIYTASDWTSSETLSISQWDGTWTWFPIAPAEYITVDAANSDPNWDQPAPVPAITSATPNPAAYNATITITGTDLAAVTTVYWDLTSAGFGYWSAPPLTVSPTSLTVQVPVSGHDGTWPMFVQAPSGNSNTLPFTVDTPDPTISSLTPNHALSPSSANIVIAGANLTGATAVHFGGAAAFGYTVNSDSQITAQIPSGTARAGSTVTVTVTTPGGTSNGLPFTYDYHTPLLLLDVRSPDPAGIPWFVLRGCEFTIEVQYPDEAQAVRVGGVDCPDFYVEPHPGSDIGFLHVKVPLTTPLAGRQDVWVLDATGVWTSWHASTSGYNSLMLVVLDEGDDPFLIVQQAPNPFGGSSGQSDVNWPNANAVGVFELDVDPVVAQRHLMAGFTHPNGAGNPGLNSDIKLQSAWYFSSTDRISLGVTANNQDGLAVGAIGDSWTDLAGGSWKTYAVVAYHVDSGFYATQQFQVVRVQQFIGSDSITPIGAATTGDSQDHHFGIAVVPLSGLRVMVVDGLYALGGGVAARCKTYSVNLTTGAMTLLDSVATSSFTLAIAQPVRDVWPIDGSRALILRGDGDLQVASVDGAGLITFGATTNVVTDVRGLTVCPDGSGGFWTLAGIGQFLDHYSISGTTITRDSRISIVSDDGFIVGGAAMIHQTSDRGDVLLVIDGTYFALGAGMSFVVETANGRAGPLWGWGYGGYGVGDVGVYTSQPRPAINLLGTAGRTQLVWVPTTAVTAGDSDHISWATYEIDEFLQPCTPFVRPGGLRWGWPLG